MNKLERERKIKENWCKYHHQGGTPLTGRIKKNAIFLRTGQAGSKEHEMKKCEVCYELQREGIPYITESIRNKKDDNHQDVRVDIVNLLTGDEIQIVCNNENHKDILQYRAEGVIPVMVNPFTCKICNKVFPIKLKRHSIELICDNCKK